MPKKERERERDPKDEERSSQREIERPQSQGRRIAKKRDRVVIIE